MNNNNQHRNETEIKLLQYINLNTSMNDDVHPESIDRFRLGKIYGYLLFNIHLDRELNQRKIEQFKRYLNIIFIYPEENLIDAQEKNICCPIHIYTNRPSRKLLKCPSFIEGFIHSLTDLPKIYNVWFNLNNVNLNNVNLTVQPTTKERLNKMKSLLAYKDDPIVRGFFDIVGTHFPNEKPISSPEYSVNSLEEDMAHHYKLMKSLKNKPKKKEDGEGFNFSFPGGGTILVTFK